MANIPQNVAAQKFRFSERSRYDILLSVGNGRERSGRYRRKLSSALLVALSVTVVAAGVAAAQDEPEGDSNASGTGGEVSLTRPGDPGHEWAEEDFHNPIADPNGPNLPCYFANYEGEMTSDEMEAILGTAEEVPGGSLVIGQPYHRICYTVDGTGIAEFFPIVYGAAGSELAVAAVLEMASENVPPLSGELTLSPDDRQVTGVETWVEAPFATQLGPETASVGDGPGEISVTVRAKLDSIKIVFTDDEVPVGSIYCQADELVEWTADADGAPCGHTFWTVPADDAPDYQMSVVYYWDYEWLAHDAVEFVVFNEDEAAPAAVFDVPVIDLEAVISRNLG